jgi:hypothetical protein
VLRDGHYTAKIFHNGWIIPQRKYFTTGE